MKNTNKNNEIDSCKEILAMNVLNEVKSYVRNSGVHIEGERQEDTDQKILEVIRDVLFKQFVKADKAIIDKIYRSLVENYYALYCDNTELLKFLTKNEFNFDATENMNLFVLDKRVSKNFTYEEILKIFGYRPYAFKDFYKSLYNADNKEQYEKTGRKFDQQEFLDMACNILKKKPYGLNERHPRFNETKHMFEINVLGYFDEDEVLELSEEQLTKLAFSSDKVEYYAELIKKYNIKHVFDDVSLLEKYFTFDEIKIIDASKFNYSAMKIAQLREKNIIDDAVVAKYKEILAINPEFCFTDYQTFVVMCKKYTAQEIIDFFNSNCAWNCYTMLGDKYGRHYDINKKQIPEKVIDKCIRKVLKNAGK